MKRSFIALVLALSMLLSLAACLPQQYSPHPQYSSEPTEDPAGSKTIYEKYYENNRYYYVVYYPDDWTFTVGEGGLELEELDYYGEAYLCCKLFPAAQGGNASDIKAAMTIYKINTNSMMNTAADFGDKMMDVNTQYYLNTVFVENGLERTSFNFRDAGTSEEHPNHFVYHTAQYDFIRDGEEWRGKFYVSSSNNTWMYVVCVESVASEWDAYYEIFQNMMHEFTFRGFEESYNK